MGLGSCRVMLSLFRRAYVVFSLSPADLLFLGCAFSHLVGWCVLWRGSKQRLEGIEAADNTAKYSERKWQRSLEAAAHDADEEGGRQLVVGSI